MMSISHHALAGTLFVAVLVATGLWHARDPGPERTPFLSGATTASAEPGPPLARVSFVNWSADGELVWGTVGEGGCLRLHKAGHNSSRTLLDSTTGRVRTAVLAPDGCHVLAGTYEGDLWWIGLETHDAPTRLIAGSRAAFFTATAIAGDGELVAAGTCTGSIYLCDPVGRTSIALSAGRKSNVVSLRFSHDGKRLVSAQNDGSITVWDRAAGKMLADFAGHAPTATAAEFLPDGKRVISAGLDDSVRIWDIASRRELWREAAGVMGVTALAVSAHGSTAAWGGFNHAIVVWNLEKNQIKFEIDTPLSAVMHLKFSPDDSHILTHGGAHAAGTIYQYDLRRGGAETRSPIRGADLDAALSR